jgi:hypothetical protein
LIPSSDAQIFIVAFSGGADSVLTAHFAAETVANRQGASLLLWYLHHYKTPVELERVKVFETMQRRFPLIKLMQMQADVDLLSQRLGYSWEHTASLLRRKYLLRLRSSLESIEGKKALVLTGHNYSDYLETLALRRERKIPESALPRLGDEDADNGFLRPLYKMTREEVRSMTAKLGLIYFEDPANEDEKFARNRLRKTHPLPPSLTKRESTALPPLLFSREGGRGVEFVIHELRLPLSQWQTLSFAEKARTAFAAFRRLAIVRRFTPNHFSRAGKLPFSLPPFFAHWENVDGVASVIFRRGLGASAAVPKIGAENSLRGDKITRRTSIAQKYGRKSVAKIFSEKKLSRRQKRRCVLYPKEGSPTEVLRMVFHNGDEMRAEPPVTKTNG